MNKIGAQQIWDRNKGLESRSGVGSSKSQTQEYRAFLTAILKQYNIRSILDVGCGDWNWMSTIDLQGVMYRGIDIVDECIEENSLKYGADNIKFEVVDITKERVQGNFDLIICRDVLFHLPENEQISALQNMPWGRFITTTSFEDIENKDLTEEEKERGWGWRKINLELDRDWETS